jgi:hypothetical protein
VAFKFQKMMHCFMSFPLEYVQRDNVLFACGSQVIFASYIFNVGMDFHDDPDTGHPLGVRWGPLGMYFV